jgi:cytochrome P450
MTALPLQVICDKMAYRKEDHQRVFDWTDVILGLGDPNWPPVSKKIRRFRPTSSRLMKPAQLLSQFMHGVNSLHWPDSPTLAAMIA